MTSLWIGRFPYWSSRVAFALRVVRLWLLTIVVTVSSVFLSCFVFSLPVPKSFRWNSSSVSLRPAIVSFRSLMVSFSSVMVSSFSSNRSESIWIIRSFCFISLLKSMSCPFESTVNPSLFFRYLYCTKRKAWLQMPSKIRLALCRKPDSSFFSQNQPVSGIFRKVIHIMMMSCSTIPGQRTP